MTIYWQLTLLPQFARGPLGSWGLRLKPSLQVNPALYL